MIFGDPYEGFEGLQFLKKAWESMSKYTLKINKNDATMEIWRFGWDDFRDLGGIWEQLRVEIGVSVCLWAPKACSVGPEYAFVALEVRMYIPRRAPGSSDPRTRLRAELRVVPIRERGSRPKRSLARYLYTYYLIA